MTATIASTSERLRLDRVLIDPLRSRVGDSIVLLLSWFFTHPFHPTFSICTHVPTFAEREFCGPWRNGWRTYANSPCQRESYGEHSRVWCETWPSGWSTASAVGILKFPKFGCISTNPIPVPIMRIQNHASTTRVQTKHSKVNICFSTAIMRRIYVGWQEQSIMKAVHETDWIKY